MRLDHSGKLDHGPLHHQASNRYVNNNQVSVFYWEIFQLPSQSRYMTTENLNLYFLKTIQDIDV